MKSKKEKSKIWYNFYIRQEVTGVEKVREGTFCTAKGKPEGSD